MTLSDQEQTLLDYFRQLSEQDAHALLKFAAFLAGQAGPTETQTGSAETSHADQPVTDSEIPQPQISERPENERVVDALKRLSTAYPMLDKKKLLDKASGMVAQHVMFGKPAKDVIDEIEGLFTEAYNKFVQERGKQ
jgi:hypothetical protein